MTAPSTKIFQTVVLPAMQLTDRSSGLLSQLNCFHLYYLLLHKVHLHICEHQVCSPWTNSALLGVVSTLKTEDNTVSIVAQDTWYRLVSCLVFPPSFLPPSQRNIDLATYDQSHWVIRNWFKLSVNASKTNLMILGLPHMTSVKVRTVSLNNKTPERVQFTKFLWVLIFSQWA